MTLVPTPFRIVLAFTILSLALLLSCSTSTDSGDEPDPLNKWPTKPEIDTDNGAPPRNAGNVPIDTKLKWTSLDPDGDPLLFDVYIGTSNPPPMKEADIAEFSYSPGPLEFSTKYYWKVIAKDGHNHKATSDIWNFTTAEAIQNPAIEISTGILNFGMSETELQFTMKNIGTGSLDWEIIKPLGKDWLSISPFPYVGTLLEDSTSTLKIMVDRNSLVSGLYTADLVIKSNNGTAVDIVQVEMRVVNGDYNGKMSIVYAHSGAFEWTFTDSIAINFVLSINSPSVSGTFDAVHFVTIVTGCSVDSLISGPFDGTISGTDLGDRMGFSFSPNTMPLSFKLKCDTTQITIPPYQYAIDIHLKALVISLEKLDGAHVFDYGSISVFSMPQEMGFSYNVTIHKMQ